MIDMEQIKKAMNGEPTISETSLVPKTNCTGTGTGAASGYGFYGITTASNCRDGDSSTNMWGGTNKNIDIDTCRKTPVEANNTTLNA